MTRDDENGFGESVDFERVTLGDLPDIPWLSMPDSVVKTSPSGGTSAVHLSMDCYTLDSSKSAAPKDPAVLFDDSPICSDCLLEAASGVDTPPADVPLDIENESHLEWAYEAEPTIKDASTWFDETTKQVYAALIDAGIHEKNTGSKYDHLAAKLAERPDTADDGVSG